MVDLSNPEVYSLVRRIYLARFSRRVRAAGLDPEETLQEVYKGILVRNLGKCPYNPAKSAMSTYIYMITSCVIMNQADKKRRRGWEVLGSGADVGELAQELALPRVWESDAIQESPGKAPRRRWRRRRAFYPAQMVA